ncbi:MAG: GAF domain-containing protein [Vicinamibacterales bacterium]|nr:GAF domain-containing protein [Vicinamibacterales bacterium]
MNVTDGNPFTRETLAGAVLQEWQSLLNVAAEIFGVRAGLITRVDGREIEILLASESEGNPYPAGYVTHFPDSGWYCERTLKARDLLLIPNALQDPEWRDNAAVVNLHMVSYVGMPVVRPDGGLFGTVCFLDDKQNAHNELYVRLLGQVRRLIELSLRIIVAKDEIDHRDRVLDGLSRIYPICCYCKKVREGEAGPWVAVEKYVQDVSGNRASHGICPGCFERASRELS